MSINETRQMLEKHNITELLSHTLFITLDQQRVTLKVDYKSGKFIAERTFKNNIFGLEELDMFKTSLNTEEKVKDHFKLGV